MPLITGVLHKADGTVAARVTGKVVRFVPADGSAVSTTDISFYTDADGVIKSRVGGVEQDGFTLLPGTAFISAPIEGFADVSDGKGLKYGRAVTIPDEDEIDFNDLVPAMSATVNNVTSGQLAAIQADVDELNAEIDALTAGAPSALNTLAEFAAAVNNDASYAATTTTALAGKQPLDPDLTAIAALAPSNDDLLQRKAGAWANRTPAQVKTDLVLVKADVGLGSVDNTSDAAKPVSTAQQAALDGKADAAHTHTLSQVTDVTATAAEVNALAGVKLYVATLTQTGSGAPAASLLTNTMGGTPTFDYVDTGRYTLTLAGAFPVAAKVYVVMPVYVFGSNILRAYSAHRTSADTLEIRTVQIRADSGVHEYDNELLSNTPLEIRVYP